MGLFSKMFGKEDDKPKVLQRDLFNIQVGDIVEFDLADYQVVGKMTFYDGGYEWYEYQLAGDHGSRWLSSEMDDELELAIYEKIPLKVSEPIPKTIEWEGVRYELSEKGTARVQGEGRSQNGSGTDVHYFDYSDETEEKLLSVEIWGGDIEVSVGRPIEDYEIKIIAGS
ncbi:MAG TPA: DUF4178 domain-containing protein [Bacillales bacterium]|nr:DUF4178 domain-containing protein [Bacillales bacterium]